MDLEGRTALVTGANRGIGRAIASELAHRGARVLAGVRERDPQHLEGVPVHAAVEAVRLDLSSRVSIEESLAELGATTQKVDVLVNNAGVYEGGLVENQDLDALYELPQVNLVAPMHLTRALLPSLGQRQGKVVNNVSIAGYAVFPGSAVYGATKAGLAGFSDALRREVADAGVTVLHLVTPGVDTEMMDEVQSDNEGHVDADGWGHVDPAEWAEKVADAIEDDRDELNPGGAERFAKLASRGPAKVLDVVSRRVFSR
jgi:short-subunit dehydrogenase